MNMKQTTRITLGLAAAVALLAAGCDTIGGGQTEHHANSLYAYLYPNQNNHVDAPTIPVLSLPLRVGIAFVPPDDRHQPNYGGDSTDGATLSESQKMALMKRISAEFKQYPFVKSIDLIPTAYLTPRGGFANLDQIRTMYGVDVMALVSYDQVQFTGEGILSVSYWTIVGAYVVPAEKNETRTMLDAAVFDIASRKLLFRAPGIGDVKDSSTLINLQEELHRNSQAGFDQAATNLTANLTLALADFKQRVTDSLAQSKALGTNAPAEYKIEYKPGYTGAGALGGTGALLVGGLGACFLWTRQNRKSGQA
jgi:rhombotail lipoprotein